MPQVRRPACHPGSSRGREPWEHRCKGFLNCMAAMKESQGGGAGTCGGDMPHTRRTAPKIRKTMQNSSLCADHLTRRSILRAVPLSVILLSTTALPRAVRAQASAPAAAQQFSFDILSAEMQALAASPFQAPDRLTGFLDDLKYDDYRLIRFRPDRARWQPWHRAAQPFA